MQSENGSKKISIKYRIEYLFFVAFIMVVKVSPVFMMKLNRKVLRFVFDKFAKRYHRIVDKNLRIAFPNETEEYIAGLKERIYRHFAVVMVEIVFMFVKKNPVKLLKPIEVINLPVLEEALKKGKGIIVFSAHFGNWELIPYILNRELNIRINSIAREMNNPLVERKVKRFREFMGSSVIYKQHSLRSILTKLKANGIVFLLIDHNTIEREAVFVDFFGQEAGAVPIVSQLHIKKGVPAVPVFLHYEKDKIVLELMDEFHMECTGDQEEDIRRMTQACASIVEEKVKQYPEQWFWFHDRWKTKGTAPQPKKEEV
jgi:Kdo2-lipid IVA lauroyltransferase/acyltransferase